MRRHSRPIILGLAATMLTTATAHASSFLRMPPVQQSYADHASCVAALDAKLAGDRARETPRDPFAPNAIRRVRLQTEGVVRVDATTARYHSTLQTQVLRDHANQQQRERSTGFVESTHTCNGAVMTSESADVNSSSRMDALDGPLAFPANW